MNLSGKTTLVTGGAKRIGKAIALSFAREGCNILLHYHNSTDEASQTKQLIESLGVKCTLLQADLTNSKSLEEMIINNKSNILSTSILINSASIFSPLAISDKNTLHNKFFDIHYHSPCRLSQVISEYITNNKERGVFINISDAMLRKPYPNYDSYFASKSALESLTKSLARTLAPNIRVNTVAPGAILFPDNYSQDEKDKILKNIPLKK